jgi:hypothetical protein
MKTILSVGVAAVALLAAFPAQAACPDDINKMRTDLQSNQSFQQRYAAGRIDRTAYTRLFEAAQTFANGGLERRCQDVLAGIKELSEKAEAQSTTPRADRDAGPDRRTDRADRLRAAQPLNAVSVSSDFIVGADVRNPADNDLGEVEDVVMDKGRISALVVERGGFLGMGKSHYMVTADKVKIAMLDDTGRTSRSRIVVIDMTPDQIKAMPKLRRERGQWMTDDRTAPPSVAPGSPPTDRAPAPPPRQQ